MFNSKIQHPEDHCSHKLKDRPIYEITKIPNRVCKRTMKQKLLGRIYTMRTKTVIISSIESNLS